MMEEASMIAAKVSPGPMAICIFSVWSFVDMKKREAARYVGCVHWKKAIAKHMQRAMKALRRIPSRIRPTSSSKRSCQSNHWHRSMGLTKKMTGS